MIEVTVRLRFTSASLGASRRPHKGSGQYIMGMTRDQEGGILYSPAWWRSITRYAARVRGDCSDKAVAAIAWDQVVEGVPREWKRYLPDEMRRPNGRPRFALHEAFPPGSVIAVNCVLPPELTIEQLEGLLRVAGTYRGISPYRGRDEDAYGRFEVISVQRRLRDCGPATAELKK